MGFRGVAGLVLAAVVLAGCAGGDKAHDDAWDLIVAERYADARSAYQSILAEDPDNPYANLNIGVAYEELGDIGMAMKHYQVAVAHGEEAQIQEVAQDGNKAPRATTVAKVARENLARLGG